MSQNCRTCHDVSSKHHLSPACTHTTTYFRRRGLIPICFVSRLTRLRPGSVHLVRIGLFSILHRLVRSPSCTFYQSFIIYLFGLCLLDGNGCLDRTVATSNRFIDEIAMASLGTGLGCSPRGLFPFVQNSDFVDISLHVQA